MTDSKFKCNIFLFLSVTVFMARLSMYMYKKLNIYILLCLFLAYYNINNWAGISFIYFVSHSYNFVKVTILQNNIFVDTRTAFVFERHQKYQLYLYIQMKRGRVCQGYRFNVQIVMAVTHIRANARTRMFRIEWNRIRLFDTLKQNYILYDISDIPLRQPLFTRMTS
jgi:hypothetical protein